MSTDHDIRILDAFRDYEAAVRLEAWTARGMPMHTPPKAVIAARGVARSVLADRLATLVGVLCIAGAGAGASNEGKG